MTNASEKAWAAWGGRSDSRGAFRSLPPRSPQTARLAVLMENLLVQLLLSGVSLCPCRTDRGPRTPPQSVVEREGPFRSIYPFQTSALWGVSELRAKARTTADACRFAPFTVVLRVFHAWGCQNKKSVPLFNLEIGLSPWHAHQLMQKVW